MGMNPFKTLQKKKPLFVALVMLGLSLVVFLYFGRKTPVRNIQTPIIVKASIQQPGVINFGFPIRLKVPKIGVDAALERVGLTPSGDLDAPKGPSKAGWYDHGPRPGEKGTAVIDGHFGPWQDGEGSVFDKLDTLQKGEKLYVEDERGTTITFSVRETRIYGPNEAHPDVFNSNDNQAHLNLITCSGVWNRANKTYSNRLVVFADEETNP